MNAAFDALSFAHSESGGQVASLELAPCAHRGMHKKQDRRKMLKHAAACFIPGMIFFSSMCTPRHAQEARQEENVEACGCLLQACCLIFKLL
jgi:hypothetical protein